MILELQCMMLYVSSCVRTVTAVVSIVTYVQQYTTIQSRYTQYVRQSELVAKNDRCDAKFLGGQFFSFILSNTWYLLRCQGVRLLRYAAECSCSTTAVRYYVAPLWIVMSESLINWHRSIADLI